MLNKDWQEWKPAVLIDSSGRQDELDCFLPDPDTVADHSCSLVWENDLYIFGGPNNNSGNHLRTISKLFKYNLKKIGSLPFDFDTGTCTNMAGVKLFLCFDFSRRGKASSLLKLCHWTTEPLGSFQKVAESAFKHDQVKISSSECKSDKNR